MSVYEAEIEVIANQIKELINRLIPEGSDGEIIKSILNYCDHEKGWDIELALVRRY